VELRGATALITPRGEQASYSVTSRETHWSPARASCETQASTPRPFQVTCSIGGMVEPMLEAGTRFPATRPTSPPERVSAAVVRAIERDVPELIFAHRRPMRLLVAMYALAPRLTERMLRATGVDQLFRKTTEYRGRL
jgi:hypothetical protein